MTEKIPCQDCGAMILPRTAEKTGGYCRICKRNRYREECLKLPKLTQEQREINRKWRYFQNKLWQMSPNQLLKQQCPSCGTGFFIRYFKGGVLDVFCKGYPACESVLCYFELEEMPIWCGTLPQSFVTDGKGGYVKKAFEREMISFKKGQIVSVLKSSGGKTNRKSKDKGRGKVIDINWNEKESDWNYVIEVEGEKCSLQLFEDEIEYYFPW